MPSQKCISSAKCFSCKSVNPGIHTRMNYDFLHPSFSSSKASILIADDQYLEHLSQARISSKTALHDVIINHASPSKHFTAYQMLNSHLRDWMMPSTIFDCARFYLNSHLRLQRVCNSTDDSTATRLQRVSATRLTTRLQRVCYASPQLD